MVLKSAYQKFRVFKEKLQCTLLLKIFILIDLLAVEVTGDDVKRKGEFCYKEKYWH